MTAHWMPLIVLLALGCHTQLIPNTNIEDTEENRAIVDFCEQYRKAVERKDIDYLLEIAHPQYYEDGGNADSSDDLDRAGLAEYLTKRFVDAQTIRYEMSYRRIGKGRKKSLLVDYRYSASYQLPSENGEVWRRTVEDNRLVLVSKSVGEGFLVLSGM